MKTLSPVAVMPFCFDPAALWNGNRKAEQKNEELDTFVAYTPKLKTEIKKRTHDELKRLQTRVNLLQNNIHAKERIVPIAQRLNQLNERANHDLDRELMCTLRREMLECEKSIADIQVQGIQRVLESIAPTIVNKLHVLVVLRAMLDGDFAWVLQHLGKPKHEHVKGAESQMLLRLDAKLLAALASVGICRSMSLKERTQKEEALNQRTLELRNAKKRAAEEFLKIAPRDNIAAQTKIGAMRRINAELDDCKVQSWAFNRQIVVNNRYYTLEADHVPMLEQLLVLADMAKVDRLSLAKLQSSVVNALSSADRESLVQLGLFEKHVGSQHAQLERRGFNIPDGYTPIDYYGWFRLDETAMRMIKGCFRPMPEPNVPAPTYKGIFEMEFDVEFY